MHVQSEILDIRLFVPAMYLSLKKSSPSTGIPSTVTLHAEKLGRAGQIEIADDDFRAFYHIVQIIVAIDRRSSAAVAVTAAVTAASAVTAAAASAVAVISVKNVSCWLKFVESATMPVISGQDFTFRSENTLFRYTIDSLFIFSYLTLILQGGQSASLFC